MATATNAFFLDNPKDSLQDGGISIGAMHPETQPCFIWGQGTPAGTLAPWITVNKGSLYFEVNGTDDESHVYMKVDEGNDAQDWGKLLIGGPSATTLPNTLAQSYASAELHGVDLVYTGTQASGGNLVALNVAHTTAGTAGSWSAAVYAKITQGTTKNVNGYLTAAEFELINTNTNPSDWFVATLNANSTNLGQHSSFLALRNYGTAVLNSLFWIGDAAMIDATGPSSTELISTLSGGKETTCSHAVRFMAGNVAYWLLASSTAPA